MAVFENDAATLQRLDWRILQNGAISLYFDSEILNEDAAWLREHGYRVHTIDCANWHSIEVFHEGISRALEFPDYYGHNLNAFNDCLSDLPVPDAGGAALQFLRFDRFAARFPDAAQGVLDIVEVNSRRFLLFGKRLIALVQSDDPRLDFEAVGACPVSWNPRERLSKNRGLQTSTIDADRSSPPSSRSGNPC